MTRRPDLFIIGAPKSGTTSLYMYLREHPDIFMSEIKEPMYFCPDVYRTSRDRFHYGRDEGQYLELFAHAGTEQRLGEASTHYMSSPAAPELINAFQPQAYIIAVLRNPVEMAYAWHGERVYKRVENAPFTLALLASDEGSKYRDVGRYATHLSRWISRFGRDRVHVIIFDDFVTQTAAEFKRTLTFLQVASAYEPESFAAHNNVSSKSRLVPLLHTPPGRMAASVVRRSLGMSRSRQLSDAIRRTTLFDRGRARPPLSPALSERLWEIYRDEVEGAGRILGRDLVAMWEPLSAQS